MKRLLLVSSVLLSACEAGTVMQPDRSPGSARRSTIVSGGCTMTCYVNGATGSDANGGATPASAKKSIQAALDQVSANGQVRVFPGAYDETAPLSSPTSIGGTYQFGLFFTSAKPGITLLGVNAADEAVNDPDDIQVTITTNATNDFGTDGIFVEADNTTIQGVTIGPNAGGDNKTIEVVADNFTLRWASTAVPGSGSIYIDDFTKAGVRVKSYHILGNKFPDGTSIDISSGAGLTGAIDGREIIGNRFELGGSPYNAISFNGSGTGVQWFINSVGGAIIRGNSFSGGSTQYIRARGTYDNSQFDWKGYWHHNSFDHAAVVLVRRPFDVRTYTYGTDPVVFKDVRRIGVTAAGEQAHAQPGDIVLVKWSQEQQQQ